MLYAPHSLPTNMNDTAPPILCFNKQECIYEQCPLYAPSIDTCKLELLKQKPMIDRKPAPRSGSPPEPKTTALEVGKLATVTGTLIDDPTIKTGTRNDGTEWTRNSFRVEVDGKPIRLTLWNPFSEDWRTLQKGDTVTFKDMAVKEYKGETQLSSIQKTDITLH